MKLLIHCLLVVFSSASTAKIYVFSGGQNTVGQFIASEVLTKAYEKLDIEIEPLFIPLQESLDKANAGITDGEIARIKSINEFAPNLVRVPVPIFSIEAVAFAKVADVQGETTDSELNISSWDDLKAHRFAIVKGSKFIEKATKDMSKKWTDTYDEALSLLNEGKTDIAVLPRLAALKIIYENQYNQIKAISPPLERVKLFHFVHKKNRKLVPLVTPILLEMKQSGEIDFARTAYFKRLTSSLESKLK
jgi:polar amino acid transport system substrate-binding protein